MSHRPNRQQRINQINTFIEDCFKSTKALSKPATQYDEMYSKLENIFNRIKADVDKIVSSGGAIKPDDQEALRCLLYGRFLQEFEIFAKEELMCLYTTIWAERFMDDVRANPFGNAGPDLLSGQ